MNGVTLSVQVPQTCIGFVLARACDPTTTVDALVASALARGQALAADEVGKKAARDMLRHGKYKPTGRGKPASEYLLQAALENTFPRIGALVDLCNLASLEALLPISLIDLARAGANAFTVRYGRADESYVFNAGGQSIGLEDLLLTAKMPEDLPCASAVKDSLATKLTQQARDVLAVIYATKSRAAVCETTAAKLAALYRDHTGATTEHGVMHG